MSTPRTGDGHTGGQKPSWRDLFVRRSSADNNGLSKDVQPLATERFRRAAGKPSESKQEHRKARWFR